jgi:hypothetical protein
MKDGRYLEWAVAGKSAGDPVIKGTMTGVCLTDTDADGNVSVDLGGVYDLSVKGIDDAGNSAVAVGEKIFYVVGDTPLLSKKASGYFFGFALEVVNSAATATINVLQIAGPGPGTADILAGSVATAALAEEAVTVAKMADLARGSILSGQTAGNRPTALDAKTSGRILVGDGTDLASVAVSGDVALAATGEVTIQPLAVEAGMIAADAVTTAKILDGNVTAVKLANGAGLAALIAAGLGASASYAKTTDGAQTLLALDASARVALIIVVVTEVFADAGGTQPVFIIGETDTTNKFMTNAILADAALDSIWVFAGSLTATKALLVTGTPAVGAGTGAIAVTALVLDAAA